MKKLIYLLIILLATACNKGTLTSSTDDDYMLAKHSGKYQANVKYTKKQLDTNTSQMVTVEVKSYNINDIDILYAEKVYKWDNIILSIINKRANNSTFEAFLPSPACGVDVFYASLTYNGKFLYGNQSRMMQANFVNEEWAYMLFKK